MHEGFTCKCWSIYTFFCVERIGHATEAVRDFDLSLIDAIVTASGDGIIYEVSNVISNH